MPYTIRRSHIRRVRSGSTIVRQHHMKVDLTKKYARFRQFPPSRFSKFRTVDIGRKGHTKIIIGKEKKTGKWETQSMLMDRKDYDDMVKERRRIQSISNPQERQRQAQIMADKYDARIFK